MSRDGTSPGRSSPDPTRYGGARNPGLAGGALFPEGETNNEIRAG